MPPEAVGARRDVYHRDHARCPPTSCSLRRLINWFNFGLALQNNPLAHNSKTSADVAHKTTVRSWTGAIQSGWFHLVGQRINRAATA